MKTRLTKTLIVIIVLYAVFSVITTCQAEDYSHTYQLLNEQNGKPGYSLNVIIPQTLYEYYLENTPRMFSSNDFAKFVTPYALKPIADSLKEIYKNEEDFANGALMIVHQMTYVETVPGKYPVETIVADRGDCDTFSCVAGSIMKAAGMDVVLLHYEEKQHMNIGVHLFKPPENIRGNPYSITHNDVEYYIAECTGGSWTRGWRVGECPEDLKQADAKVITLENAESIAPGQVTASFTTLESSNLSLEISPAIAIEESVITVQGYLTPSKPDENVTIYLGTNDSPWSILGTTVTQSDGSFRYVWKSTTSGIYSVRASWAGDELYAGSMSLTRNGTVIPLFLSVLIVIAVFATAVGAVAILASRHAHGENLEPREPQPPTFS